MERKKIHPVPKKYIYIKKTVFQYLREAYTSWLGGSSGFKPYIGTRGHIKLPLGGIFSLGETPERLSGLQAVTTASTDTGLSNRVTWEMGDNSILDELSLLQDYDHFY